MNKRRKLSVLPVTGVEKGIYLILCLIAVLVMGSGDTNGLGYFQGPKQNLLYAVVAGCVINGAIIYTLAILIIPIQLHRKKYPQLVAVLLLCLLVINLIKTVFDQILILLFYPSLLKLSFYELFRENEFFTLTIWLFAIFYGLLRFKLARVSGLGLDNVTIKSGKKIYSVPSQSILFFEASGNYVKVISDQGAELVYSTINKLDKELDPSIFQRVHRSYIISVYRVNKYYGNAVDIGGRTIRVSKQYQKQLKSLLHSAFQV